MKKHAIIFLLLFFSCKGFSQNSNEIGFWTSLQHTIEDKIGTDLFIKDEYQSTYKELLKKVSEDFLDSLGIIFQSMVRDEYLFIFLDEVKIDIQLDTLEVVFNSKESVVIETANFSGVDFRRIRSRTLNKVEKFLEYVEKNNSLPQNTFEYLNYKFSLLRNDEKWLYVTYRISPNIEIIDRMIKKH
jgi:hypothetical protein